MASIYQRIAIRHSFEEWDPRCFLVQFMALERVMEGIERVVKQSFPDTWAEEAVLRLLEWMANVLGESVTVDEMARPETQASFARDRILKDRYESDPKDRLIRDLPTRDARLRLIIQTAEHFHLRLPDERLCGPRLKAYLPTVNRDTLMFPIACMHCSSDETCSARSAWPKKIEFLLMHRQCHHKFRRCLRMVKYWNRFYLIVFVTRIVRLHGCPASTSAYENLAKQPLRAQRPEDVVGNCVAASSRTREQCEFGLPPMRDEDGHFLRCQNGAYLLINKTQLTGRVSKELLDCISDEVFIGDFQGLRLDSDDSDTSDTEADLLVSGGALEETSFSSFTDSGSTDATTRSDHAPTTTPLSFQEPRVERSQSYAGSTSSFELTEILGTPVKRQRTSGSLPSTEPWTPGESRAGSVTPLSQTSSWSSTPEPSPMSHSLTQYASEGEDLVACTSQLRDDDTLKRGRDESFSQSQSSSSFLSLSDSIHSFTSL